MTTHPKRQPKVHIVTAIDAAHSRLRWINRELNRLEGEKKAVERRIKDLEQRERTA